MNFGSIPLEYIRPACFRIKPLICRLLTAGFFTGSIINMIQQVISTGDGINGQRIPFRKPDIHIGDGWHVYPAKNGVLNSLRWEQMRNGIQDYEYFWMLEDKIKALKDSLGSRFPWIDPKQRGKEIAGNVVMDFAEHSDDPGCCIRQKWKLSGS